MRKVETQPIGRDEGAGLLDVVTEDLTKRRLQKMRRRVIVHRREPAPQIDGGENFVAHVQFAVLDSDPVET